MSALDSRSIAFKLDEIKDDIRDLRQAILDTGLALCSEDQILADARLKNFAVMERAQEVAKEVAILREMLGVR